MPFIRPIIASKYERMAKFISIRQDSTSGINKLRSHIKHDCTNLICVQSISPQSIPCNVELNEEEKATIQNMFAFESVFMAIQTELVKRNLISNSKGDAQRLEEFIEKKIQWKWIFRPARCKNFAAG